MHDSILSLWVKTDLLGPLGYFKTLILASICFLLMYFCLPTTDSFADDVVEDAVILETLEICRTSLLKAPNDNNEIERGIRSLSYIQQRALRAMCRVSKNATLASGPLIEELRRGTFRYKTTQLLDFFTGLEQASVPLTWHLLKLLEDSSFVTIDALSSLDRLTPPNAPSLLALIDEFMKLDDPGQWAAKALFEIDGIQFEEVKKTIILLTELTPSQQRAAEQFCKLHTKGRPDIYQGIVSIGEFSTSEAWNAQAILQKQDISLDTAENILFNFLGFPVKEKELRFKSMSARDKTLLLDGYNRAAEKLIRQINNLHDITDSFGREIGDGRLNNYSFEQLNLLFTKLHPTAQKTWQAEMDRVTSQKKKREAITILHRATEQARRESGSDLISANIYILLANGNELYTSSFRNVLVPILRKRIDLHYDGDLLFFLVSVDPDNSYSSKFITNLAWKGALTGFFPKDSDKQKKVLQLVAASAFQDEYSLLLFSATIAKLFQTLQPKARSYLVALMMEQIDHDKSVFSRQLQIILQFFHAKHPKLLSNSDNLGIQEMLTLKGVADITQYSKTPIAEWLQDHSLKSLSVFQKDDDGRASFLTNCRGLHKNGYTPEFSIDFPSVGVEKNITKDLNSLFKLINSKPEHVLNQLFRFSVKHPIVIDWKKNVHNTRITHSVAVYQNKMHQQELLVRFMKSGYEMYAQRGHSYWRRHQLFAPLTKMLETGKINKGELLAKQRFLSLGSCGGIKAYLTLGKFFENRVDILATVGTGQSTINNPYNRALFEIIATYPETKSWDQIASKTAKIFQEMNGEEYLQPGSLPTILHKTMYNTGQLHGTD